LASGFIDERRFCRAVQIGSGEPPAALMGASEVSDQIESDICAQVRTLQIVRVIVSRSEAPPPEGAISAEIDE